MLKDIGANYVIIGHSENREKGETDKIINQKIKSAIEAKLKVIFCIGETFKQKKNGKTKSVLFKQISESVPGEYLGRLVLGMQDEDIKIYGCTIF